MPQSFGARLRHERERQHIALAAITEQTKIKQSLLEALERDDVSHWPTGIFRRAYIRAYAHALGLEPEVIVREFLELYPDPTEVVAGPNEQPDVDRERPSRRPPMRLRYLVDSALRALSWRSIGVTPPSASPVRIRPPQTHAISATLDADLRAAADLCTALGRASTMDDITTLLREAARILDAVGIVVWVWDPQTARLKPELAFGYSENVLAHVPPLERDADNATAAAFRSAQLRVVASRDLVSGALVVPVMTAAGCAGVLALELQDARERAGSVRALAIIFASLLARAIESAEQSARIERRLA